ncbi:MAG: trigger factor [Verrucomicrobiae bacterium]|nr:trigger factor [Verrucomicrobiae bacterium]
MNITVENVAACRKKLNIEIPMEDVVREWNATIREFQKYAQIPGFRVGRAPIAILEKRFVKEIGDEVQKKLIPQSFREAVAKEKLDVVSMPQIEEVKFNRNEPLQYKAQVDVAPEFALPEYKGLKIKKTLETIKDEDVESGLKLLAEQQARFEDVTTRPVAFGDFAVISYTGTCDGKPIAEIAASAANLSQNNHFWLIMAKDSFLPGFCDQLNGASIGDKKQIEVDFPADFRIKELSGKKASFAVELQGIREKKLPPMDDALATAYQAKDLAELRQRVRENLTKASDRKSEASLRQQVVDQLKAAVNFDLPETLVQSETYHLATDIVRENHQRGVEDNILREKSKEIFASASQNAQERVKMTFIIHKIAKAEKIEVPEKEVDDLIQAEATHAGKPYERLRSEMLENGSYDSLRERLLSIKIMDFLVSKAAIEEQAAPAPSTP